MSNLTDTTSSPPSQSSPNASWTYFYPLLLLLYPTICALLRYNRLRTTLETFPYTTRRTFASMTDKDAMRIQQIIGELEFPFTFEKALQFALFRTYGIPTISKLLCATSQFSEPSTACKRYSDTGLLISEFMGHEPTSERTRQAIGRMNYIHSGYQRSGKILDDDMLYTLALFACEPVRWINKYEWRRLEDFEVCALGTFWKSVGDAMGISWEKLKSGRGGKEGTWRDGLEWWEEICEWSQAYEREKMVPAETNRKTAEETTRILLWTIPGPLKGVGRHLVSALMDDRLRKAMMCVPARLLYFLDIDNPIGIPILRHSTTTSYPSPSASANTSSATSLSHALTSCALTT